LAYPDLHAGCPSFASSSPGRFITCCPHDSPTGLRPHLPPAPSLHLGPSATFRVPRSSPVVSCARLLSSSLACRAAFGTHLLVFTLPVSVEILRTPLRHVSYSVLASLRPWHPVLPPSHTSSLTPRFLVPYVCPRAYYIRIELTVPNGAPPDMGHNAARLITRDAARSRHGMFVKRKSSELCSRPSIPEGPMRVTCESGAVLHNQKRAYDRSPGAVSTQSEKSLPKKGGRGLGPVTPVDVARNLFSTIPVAFGA